MRVLGFDIGVASIGWALVEDSVLKDCGVRIFTKAENPKDGSSLALPRREARSVRRRLARRKARLNELKRLVVAEFGLNLEDFLANAGELPRAYKLSKCEIADYDSYEKRKAIRKNNNTQEKEKLAQELEKCDTNPYKLRFEALNRESKLEPLEFARVILHIAKHRGYGNKHAKDTNDDDSGKVKKAISQNADIMSQKDYKSVGEYLYKEFYQQKRDLSEKSPKNAFATQEFQNVRNKKENYARCVAQSELKRELELIFETQKRLGWKFSEKKYQIFDENRKIKEVDFESAVMEVAFLQRPLKSSADKVGKCTFFADEFRAPKDSLSAMEFVALTRIINTLANISKKTGEIYSADKVSEVLKAVLEKGELTYKNLREIISLDDKIQFPKDSKLDYAKGDEAEKAKFIEFKKLKDFKKALGGSFEGFSRAELDTIAVCITLIKDKVALLETLKLGQIKDKNLNKVLNETQKMALSSVSKKLNEAQRKALSELNFDKFINLSFKALGKILPFMRGENGECKRYDEAWRTAGLQEAAKQTQKGSTLPPLKDYEKDLANPVVARALSEYRKVLNALLEKHGKVHKIHLEFTREAGVSSKERGELIAEQNKRFKANEEARKRCAEFGLNPSGKNILKLKLWQEQGGQCVYSGKNITREHLCDESALEIDHIYPYSRSFDDSQNNKVLVFKSANQNKRNQTPYEAFGSDSEKWSRIMSSIAKLPKPKKNRIANKNFADKESGFIARNIVDTSYIATLTASYTDAFIEFLPLVESEYTTLGEEIKGEDTKLKRGEKGSKKHISVVSGSLTATMRHYWGLDSLLNGESEVKDRSNHLHHALDAIIIAYTNDKIIEAFSDFKKTQEQNTARLIAKEISSAEYKISRRFFAPANFANNEAFRQNIKGKIFGELGENGELSGGIFVSKPPRKRARGALHKEGFGYVDKKDKWKVKFYNPSSEKLVIKDYGGKYGLEKALQLGKIHALIKGNQKEQDDLGLHKFALNENMPRLDIYKRGNKFYAVPIYTMDFAKGKLPNIAIGDIEMSESEFCFSLFKDDLIVVRKKGMSEAIKCYYKSFDIDSCRIFIEKHDNYYTKMSENESKLFTEKAKKNDKLQENSERKIIGGRVSIQNLEIFEKWQVSPLGEVKKAEFKKRENISLKSTPKTAKHSMPNSNLETQ